MQSLGLFYQFHFYLFGVIAIAAAIVFGLGLAFSSTAIVLQLLIGDRRLGRSHAERRDVSRRNAGRSSRTGLPIPLLKRASRQGGAPTEWLRDTANPWKARP